MYPFKNFTLMTIERLIHSLIERLTSNKHTHTHTGKKYLKKKERKLCNKVTKVKKKFIEERKLASCERIIFHGRAPRRFHRKYMLYGAGAENEYVNNVFSTNKREREREMRMREREANTKVIFILTTIRTCKFSAI